MIGVVLVIGGIILTGVIDRVRSIIFTVAIASYLFSANSYCLFNPPSLFSLGENLC